MGFVNLFYYLSSVYGYEKKHVMLLTVDTGAKTNVVKIHFGMAPVLTLS